MAARAKRKLWFVVAKVGNLGRRHAAPVQWVITVLHVCSPFRVYGSFHKTAECLLAQQAVLFPAEVLLLLQTMVLIV
jgi:hypothetical protein